MSRVGARREREGTVPRATAVPRLAKPARHAGYAPGAHRAIGGCRRSGEAASLRRAGQRIATEASAGRAVPRLSRRLSPAATCGARGSPSVPLSRSVATRDVSRVGILDAPHRMALHREPDDPTFRKTHGRDGGGREPDQPRTPARTDGTPKRRVDAGALQSSNA